MALNSTELSFFTATGFTITYRSFILRDKKGNILAYYKNLGFWQAKDPELRGESCILHQSELNTYRTQEVKAKFFYWMQHIENLGRSNILKY